MSFSKMDPELTDLLALRLYIKTRQKRRREYILPIYEKRRIQSQMCLVKELYYDEERHFNYFRMTRHRFEDLLRKVGPSITPQRIDI